MGYNDSIREVTNMTISERIFELIREKGYTQKEFSKKTGIAESTISDWKKKGTNPVSDKILVICEVLEVSPYFLLGGAEKQDGRTRDGKAVKESGKSAVKSADKPKAAVKATDKPKAEVKSTAKPKADKNADKVKAEAPKKAVLKPGEIDVTTLPKIAVISSDDMDYHIRDAEGDDKPSKDKKKDKSEEKIKDKKDRKDKKDKKKKEDKKDKKDKKKKKKGYLITY